MRSVDIDQTVGALTALVKRTMNRTPTDQEIEQMIDMVGGLVSQVLIDLNRAADALEKVAAETRRLATATERP